MIVIRQPRNGFTLIEVLVAMSLGLVILMLAIAMLERSRDDYARIGGGISAECEARALLTQLTAELQTASFHKHSVFAQSTAAWPLDRLGFLSLQPATAQSPTGRIGDLCAIQYYLKDLLINGKTVRCLMRGFRESDATFKALGADQTATLFTNTDRDEPVAFGIISFEARPQVRNSSGHWQPWQKTTTQPPSAIAIRLVIVRSDIVAKLTNTDAWNGTGPTSSMLGEAHKATTNRHLEVYTSLVRCGNHTTL
jgi:prepilin-type N-terminal cleavage/methylation domain-containing protein